MNILKNTKKITLASLKSFAKRNSDKLFVKECSSFDGMTDCVEEKRGSRFVETKIGKSGYYRTGINGVYTVGSSRDYLKLYEDSEYIGIEVYNCCGKSILTVKK